MNKICQNIVVKYQNNFNVFDDFFSSEVYDLQEKLDKCINTSDCLLQCQSLVST